MKSIITILAGAAVLWTGAPAHAQRFEPEVIALGFADRTLASPDGRSAVISFGRISQRAGFPVFRYAVGSGLSRISAVQATTFEPCAINNRGVIAGLVRESDDPEDEDGLCTLSILDNAGNFTPVVENFRPIGNTCACLPGMVALNDRNQVAWLHTVFKEEEEYEDKLMRQAILLYDHGSISTIYEVAGLSGNSLASSNYINAASLVLGEDGTLAGHVWLVEHWRDRLFFILARNGKLFTRKAPKSYGTRAIAVRSDGSGFFQSFSGEINGIRFFEDGRSRRLRRLPRGISVKSRYTPAALSCWIANEEGISVREILASRANGDLLAIVNDDRLEESLVLLRRKPEAGANFCPQVRAVATGECRSKFDWAFYDETQTGELIPKEEARTGSPLSCQFRLQVQTARGAPLAGFDVKIGDEQAGRTDKNGVLYFPLTVETAYCSAGVEVQAPYNDARYRSVRIVIGGDPGHCV